MSIDVFRRWTLLPFVFTAALTSAALTSAAPVPVLNVADLVGRADLIVVGRISYVTDAGPGIVETPNGRLDARGLLGEIQIDRVLKGTANASSVRFQFTLPDIPMGYRGVSAGSYRVVFLTGSKEPYRFASPYHPSVIAQPNGSIASEEAVDRVLEAVGSVLLSRESTAMDKREAINVLWGINNAPARAALRAALADRDSALQLHASAALLAGNDVSALPIATEALLQTAPTLPDDVLLNLRGAISRGLTTDAAVPSLGRLLAAKDPATRRAAASALGHTKSTAAVAHLSRSLDDKDVDVRLASVRALAEITGQKEYAPSDAAFRADEERFLEHWKSWISRR